VRPRTDLLLQSVGVGLALLAFIYKLPALRRNPSDVPLRAFAATVLFMAAALTVLVDPAYGWVDRLSGIPNLAQLAGNCLGLCSSSSSLILLANLSYPRQRATRLTRVSVITAAGVAAALILLFFTGAPRPETRDFWVAYMRQPEIAAYRILFVAYIAFVLANVIFLALRYASVSSRPTMRIGLRLVAAGGVVGQFWVVLEAARVIAPLAGLPSPPAGAELAGRADIAVTIALIALGSTLPGWGHRLRIDEAVAWSMELRSLRRLYPLWNGLHDAAPEVMLTPPRSRLADLFDFQDVHFRLYRRVVEIRDALLLLNADAGPAGDAPGGDFTAEVRSLESLARAYRRTGLPPIAPGIAR
jgi:hypothetical protein